MGPDRIFEQDAWDPELEVADLEDPFEDPFEEALDLQGLDKDVLPSVVVAHSVVASDGPRMPIDCSDSTHFHCSNRSFSCAHHHTDLGVAAEAVAVASPMSLKTWFVFDADPSQVP